MAENTTGMGVVVRGNRSNTLDVNFNKFYDYCVMDKNRKLSQNVIDRADMINWIKDGTLQ